MPKLTLVPPLPGAPRRLDSFAAAPYLGVSRDTLAKWRTIGRPHIPYTKVGNKVIYDQADLDAFLAKHRVDEPKAGRA